MRERAYNPETQKQALLNYLLNYRGAQPAISQLASLNNKPVVALDSLQVRPQDVVHYFSELYNPNKDQFGETVMGALRKLHDGQALERAEVAALEECIVTQAIAYFQNNPQERVTIIGVDYRSGSDEAPAPKQSVFDSLKSWWRGSSSSEEESSKAEEPQHSPEERSAMRGIADAFHDAEYEVDEPLHSDAIFAGGALPENFETLILPKMAIAIRMMVDNGEVPDTCKQIHIFREFIRDAQSPEAGKAIETLYRQFQAEEHLGKLDWLLDKGEVGKHMQELDEVFGEALTRVYDEQAGPSQ